MGVSRLTATQIPIAIPERPRLVNSLVSESPKQVGTRRRSELAKTTQKK